ncbi:MAG: hypothetical protein CMA12_00365 [Euryarchaeota archaeon]|nr:hypothetical protein [Euryarchaeota archaeon]
MKAKNIPQLILDFVVCALFTLMCMVFLKFTLPAGYTTKFLDRGYVLVSLLFIFLSLIFIVSLFINKDFKIKKKFDLPSLKDFFLLGLPMSPVVSYVILNIEYLNTMNIIYVVGITLFFCLILCFILPSLFSYFASFKILMISGLAISFTVLNMPQITNNPTNYIYNSQFITQGIYLIISFFITFLLYSVNKTITYVVVIVFMLSGGVINFLNYYSKKNTNTEQIVDRLKVFISNDQNKIIYKKNIYILVYESYSNLETLKYYGYNNDKQIDFLTNNGFTIYHGIYSNGAKSLSSTSRILELKNKLNKDERYYLNGNAFILDILKANGYETIGLFKSPYSFGSAPITWDKYYPKDDVSKIGGKTIVKAIYEGYFRFDIFDDNYDYSKYLNLRNDYLSLNNEKPTLFYTHNNFPGHSQNSGKCLNNEKENHFKGIETANIEMKNDINTLKKSNPNSIIVILGDHGPYLTKNCTALLKKPVKYIKSEIDRYDIQDRYGAFLAIHWPEEINLHQNNIQIIQDIFPAILANITENEGLFEELKLERRFLDNYNENVAGININKGIIEGGKDDKKPLFEIRSYKLE